MLKTVLDEPETGLPSSRVRPADEYELQLVRSFASKDSARFPVFDVITPSAGPDGQTASLFPGRALLNETIGWVAPIYNSSKPPPCRITLAVPVINHAACIVLVPPILEMAPESINIVRKSDLPAPNPVAGACVTCFCALFEGVDLCDELVGPEVTITAAAIDRFYDVIGNQGEKSKTSRNLNVEAPMNFVIVTGWQVCFVIMCCFGF
jgi:Glucosamine-6-phosphate isomerases/6-phosphogluconolactonase